MTRYFMAVAATAMVLALFLLAWWGGVIGSLTLLVAVALAGGFVIAFYAVFRSGLNLRAADPSLTAPQMLASLAVILFAVQGAGAGHAVLLPLLIISLAFGIFRLDTIKLLAISGFVSVAYAAILITNLPDSVPGGHARLAMVYWGIVTLTLLFISIVGGYISQLRKRLAESKRELEQAFSTIEHAASHDALTGVYNRRRLNEILGQELERSRRYKTQFSVCLFDVDHFKAVNDTYGHAAGDAVLSGLAGSLAECVRNTDYIGRYGGEEFLGIMVATPADGALVCAERVRTRAKELRFDGLPAIRISVSGGVACYRDGENIEEILSRTDQALYRAKQGGRDRVEVAPD